MKVSPHEDKTTDVADRLVAVDVDGSDAFEKVSVTPSEARSAMLRLVPQLCHLDEKTITQLAHLMSVCEYPAGAILALEDQVGVETFIVVEGQVEISVGGRLIGYAGSGEFLGEMAQFGGGRRSATLRALTPLTVLVIGPHEFAQMLHQPLISKAVMEGLVGRLRMQLEAPETIPSRPRPVLVAQNPVPDPDICW